MYRMKIIEIENLLLKGYISNIIDTTNLGGTKKTYVLSFPAFPGFSGAPLLTFENESIHCIGIIYKNHEMLLPPEEKEVDIEGEKVIKHIHRAFYFGWAMDANPLLDIKNLLNNYNKTKHENQSK